MLMNTTSEVISFSEMLENESAAFYEAVSQKFKQNQEMLSQFIAENKKNIEQIKRSYYGSITDAIEGCFGFKLNRNDYTVDFSLPGEISYEAALKKALTMETTIKTFYEDSAEQTKSLMSDVARAFVVVARKRGNRNAKIKDILA